jgi:glycosyltransferase involved in cell wall biosynthesis
VGDLRGVLYGDGPERAAVQRAIEGAGVSDCVRAPGFVGHAELEAALRSALCLLLPSSREGYGLIVVEAASKGTPCIVVAGPDNAAVELVEDGVNGVVAPSASPQDLASAILRVHAEGRALRERTCAWFATHAERLSLERSLRHVAAAYERWDRARS